MRVKEKILLLNGPNLNLLGKREQNLYGNYSLTEIVNQLTDRLNAIDYMLIDKQSNSESALINIIHNSPQEGVKFMLINLGAFTHTSIALRDAILAVNIPFIEIHCSNIYARESFRHHSYFSDIAVGVICGFHHQSYLLALNAALFYLSKKDESNNLY